MNSEKSSNSNSNRSSLASSSSTSKLEVFVNPATVALKLLVLWIYIDAGWENISIRNKDGRMPWFPYPRWIPIVAIRWVHNTSLVLGPTGLRFLSPLVVYTEIWCVPLAAIGAYYNLRTLVYGVIYTMCGMHFGIALTIRNSNLFSSVCLVIIPATIIG
mmetsp:Transcript_38716/g.39084  ORF Transcript_38716/g.39084 Transcript_38716/m.39084 type:complete len:159 (+) Transcript_38716:2-478(+)